MAMVDTGCQAVCIGPQQLSQLGLSKWDLKEVEMKLSAANGSGLKILGALFIKISGESRVGNIQTRPSNCAMSQMGLRRCFYQEKHMRNYA